ncbi:MAG: hypothetical protein JWL72_3826 [Ilumatobacteraceae bacterium]|nr:hypothetical protein [Ilumatobacteraceae bacterium]
MANERPIGKSDEHPSSREITFGHGPDDIPWADEDVLTTSWRTSA